MSQIERLRLHGNSPSQVLTGGCRCWQVSVSKMHHRNMGNAIIRFVVSDKVESLILIVICSFAVLEKYRRSDQVSHLAGLMISYFKCSCLNCIAERKLTSHLIKL